ncbi:MAG: prolyl oligopeptidase family serine peptidase, partial [Gemmatimonadetes bacterium]|nr:S9 family peptidase [Gemmatimonadota bacterium]NIQ59166.1 S9 family peptidase [Gemmatimonadota bacterium]NIU79361.1 prolyl oligopeptidase family serine peptidase [Gammaproteobacteria bacterium]NIX48030.1 prolyl oligopeptidase family serine peptidase [Gemmatimonadota bacterium]NIY12409.1 prolyl oligopeptidase family serine peptidase [Gemmatimonadota bacterium]
MTIRAPSRPSVPSARRLVDVLARRVLGAAAPLIACAGIAAPPAAAQVGDTAAPRPMTVVDLIEVPSLRDPRLSPDGGQVLYVRTDADWEENRTIGHIWRIGVDGAGAIRLTNGEGESSPRWSPGADRIAFLAERGEDEHDQVWLIRADGGEAWRLTEHPTDVGDLEWSPDGRWIYFTAPDEKSDEEKRRAERKDDVIAFEEDYQQRHIWRVDVGTGEDERVTEGDFSVVDYSLSRDGHRIVLARGPTPLLDDLRAREVYLMDAAPGAPMTRLTENDVPEYSPRLSPDNRRVLFLADSNEDFESYYNDNLFLVDAEPGARSRMLLPDMPHEVNAAEWSADGRSIHFVANTGVRRELFRVAVDTEDLEQVTDGDHAIGSWSYRPDLDRHVLTLSDPHDPGEIWSVDPEGAQRQVTSVFDDLADRFRLPEWEVVRWPGADGTEVEGILFLPLDRDPGQRHPLVVQTHGGPASSDKLAWEGSTDYVQKLTGMGYAVLKPNYRGSTGYGDDFLRDMVPGYFDQAHKDVMAGVDHLIERGLVDGDRMAKMGWSAGGHMTNKIITFTDRFKAASSGAGAANWISMYAQSDVRIYRTPWFGGTPWQTDPPLDVYLEHSPITAVAAVTTPTIFLVGRDDPRVPLPQSVEMYRALEANGVPTHLYIAPREGHGWRELRHRLF